MKLERRRLLAAGIVTAVGAVFGAGSLAQTKEKVIRVTARKWVFLPREIRLKKGVPVVLEFVTADVVMGFNAPDFNEIGRASCRERGSVSARAVASYRQGAANGTYAAGSVRQ